MKILIVDDNADTVTVLSKILRRSGYAAMASVTAEGALRAVEDEHFDLVFCNIMLTDGNGFDLFRELKARRPELRGIALTGFGREEDVQRAREAGFDMFLTKPVTADVLRAAIVGVLTER